MEKSSSHLLSGDCLPQQAPPPLVQGSNSHRLAAILWIIYRIILKFHYSNCARSLEFSNVLFQVSVAQLGSYLFNRRVNYHCNLVYLIYAILWNPMQSSAVPWNPMQSLAIVYNLIPYNLSCNFNSIDCNLSYNPAISCSLQVYIKKNK